MKNKPLAFQIWVVICGIILAILLILAVLFAFTLRSFFTNEVYNTIEAAQMKYTARLSGEKINKKKYMQLMNEVEAIQNIRSVSHIKYPSTKIVEQLKLHKLYNNKQETEKFLNEIIKQVKNQKSKTKRYEKNINGKKIFYVIYKFNAYGKEGFLLSYMWDTYRNSLITAVFSKFLIIIVIAVIISLVAALKISKYLTQPLKKLEKNVSKIAKRDWYEPIISERQDEIGKLSYSIENMRKQLVKRDENQQWMLQNISHELKTPVMVIRSYAQAVEDRIYPKGDLNSTMHVIDSEAERLQKRIKDLLYLTKFEYMSKHQEPDEVIDIKKLIESVVERFKYNSSKISWHIYLDDAKILGKIDQWKVVIENLLDNNIRYAREKISIVLKKNRNHVVICFHNDGEAIDEKILPNLFNQFQKGKKGKFGLGLAIVKQIVQFHKGEIWAVNEENGVSFYIKIEAYHEWREEILKNAEGNKKE
ncbi:HAMP domain-containing sensor histidine kinase [Clostridium aestuarii]|uniref:histidine kinase n=1 Tax=Clostridium aestuarii TaxID=338193 RepID=A0ABT4D0R3_9CLOT|nr:HAMP domain-containing sensor histidine kinase [Clostridium aestuarii]MCY6484829.1 HAMP domain-containing sensor histidine kinase [Clostridium aestuarii]